MIRVITSIRKVLAPQWLAVAAATTLFACSADETSPLNTSTTKSGPTEQATARVIEVPNVIEDPFVYEILNFIIETEKLDRSIGLSRQTYSFQDMGTIDLLKPPSEFGESSVIYGGTPPGIFRTLSDDDAEYLRVQGNAPHEEQLNLDRLGMTPAGSDLWNSLSYPVFTRDTSLVVVSIGHLCPGLCGSGYNVVLRRGEKGWMSASVGGWFH